jgi:uncharacterized membrane protein YbhN (UPF0104 family)
VLPVNVRSHVKPSRRVVLAAAALTAALAAVAFAPQLLGPEIQRALAGLSGARPLWLWTAAGFFLVSIGGAAAAYRSAFGLVGARLAPLDAAARYGVGSLVNTFAPARLGDAVRLALFSRAIDSEERLWRTGGVFAAIGAARASVLALLVVAGAAAGALPLWPVLVCLGIVGVAVAVAVVARDRAPRSHVSHLLDAFRALGREPRQGARIVGWVLLATIGRLGAAASIAAALGVHGPLAAAVMIVPALDLAGTMPLTPGNVGITSGAVAMALSAHGVPMTVALTTGIAFHAVETCSGLVSGIASGLFLLELQPSRRWTVVAAGAAMGLAVIGAFSATVLIDVL